MSADTINRKGEGTLRPVTAVNDEWSKLQSNAEDEPVIVEKPIVDRKPAAVVPVRVESPNVVDVVPESKIVAVAKNFAIASVAFEVAEADLSKAQRVYELAVEDKQKAYEELKQAISQEINDGIQNSGS